MNDQQLLEDLLTSVKGTCNLYMNGVIESGTTQVHNAFNQVLFKSIEMQNEIFNKMTENGWYQKTQVPAQKIIDTKNKVAEEA